MEGDKSKKKRNKRKKTNNNNNNNGQNRALDEVLDDQSQASTEVKDVELESHGKESGDVCLSGNGSIGSDSTNLLIESEEQKRLQKEAMLEETIRKLQEENDSYLKKEATLVGTVNQLQQENNSHLRKEFIFEETIKQLRDQNTYIQREASHEMKIDQLQREKDSWVQKESQLEERISRLVDEKITWNLKEESLEDRIKHLEAEKQLLILKEDSNRVMIGDLSDDIARLRGQVVELEETRNNLVNENRRLMEYISSLQLQIKDIQGVASTQTSLDKITELASERDGFNSQVEAAFALVERLMEENAELVEKVSELLIQVDRHRGSDARPSTVTPELIVVGSEPSGQESSSIEVIPIKEESNGNIDNTGDYHSVDVLPGSSMPEESGEIVQIPLDENDVSDVEEDEEAAPFSDAPLIGAPFRLISFVSRYVSGADLVEKNSLQV